MNGAGKVTFIVCQIRSCVRVCENRGVKLYYRFLTPQFELFLVKMTISAGKSGVGHHNE